MKKWDEVRVNTDIKKLTDLGIYKGYEGTIVEKKGSKYTVWFDNPNNFGEYAFVEIEEEFLDFIKSDIYPKHMLIEMQGFVERINLENHTSLTEVKVKENDKVELLVDKPEYAKENVYKGAHGCVMQPYAIENKIEVEFYNIEGHKYGCVELMVDLEDIKVVE